MSNGGLESEARKGLNEELSRWTLPGDADALPRPFGRLLLLRRMARGGMGEVYLAATRGIEGAERPVVVKTIRPEHVTDKSFRARFLDETRIMAQLQHPGVLQILEASTTIDDVPFAVVEYIEGRHLGEVLQRSSQLGVRIEWADAVAIGTCFADALGHIHTRTDATGRPLEIAHRDLSPQNVMIGYSGDLKLIDFGTARGENRRCRTVAGVVYAKPGYVAPEVAQQIPGGAPADFYAFGIMLWELTAGRKFLQGDPVEHQARVARGEARPPALSTILGCPAALDVLIARLTDPDPVRRLSDGGRVVRELVELLKLSPSLADGDRSVRGRIAHLMSQLYPAEPARSRVDFARRLAQAREACDVSQAPRPPSGVPEPSPSPPFGEEEVEGLLEGTRYRLDKRIATGALSEVWEATHVDLGRTVALKITTKALAASHQARARFRAEARSLARLTHEGLVKLHDFGFTADGRSYFGMELLSGETLEARLARGPLGRAECLRIVREMLVALEVAHGAGLVHRDITPSNLFLTAAGVTKLIDFGVAFSPEQPAQAADSEAPLAVGTPEYISPEQAAGAEADQRSDLYSVGAVLYEALTGQVPHRLGPGGAPTLAALLTAKITTAPVAPSSVRKDLGVDGALDRIVLRALHRDPNVRFQTAREFVAALDAIGARPERRQRRAFSSLRAPATWAATALALGLGLWLGPTLSRLAVPGPALAAPALAPAAIQVGPSNPGAVPSERVPAPSDLAPPPPTLPETPARAAEPEPAAEAQKNTPPAVRAEIGKARELMEAGQSIAAHHKMKAIAKKYPEDPGVLAALADSAKAVKAWGEALDAATRRVAAEPTADAYTELAKIERATLRGNPIASLQQALLLEPKHLRAKALLERYQRDEELARR